MPNFFKKLQKGSNNLFKKIDSGSSNFFKKIPSQVNSVVSATKKGLNQGLDAVGDVARKVGNTLEKAGPAIAMGASMIAPEFAVPIMAATTAATALSRQVQSGARQGQAMTNQLAQTINNKSNQVLKQAQSGLNVGMNNLKNQANNTLAQGQNNFNNLKSQANSAITQGQNGYNNAVQNASNALKFIKNFSIILFYIYIVYKYYVRIFNL